jgi:alkanesulfonate monooxygenase SsuD/methylene tetrahydromethanopterin reductase-like flavin-dependent oxidoreductase (luciferase family)
MKFLAITPITHLPDPITGRVTSPTDRLRAVVDGAVRAERLGFHGFGVAERHERPFISCAPPVLLSHIAARTSVIRLFAAPRLLDPIRAFEDYATLDQLSGGRLEVIIGPGAAENQRDAAMSAGEQFRRLCRGEKMTQPGPSRPFRPDEPALPRPLQQPIPIWHDSTTGTDCADLAARWGGPLLLANVAQPLEPHAELVRRYRERWEFYRRDPAGLLVGAAVAGYYGARTSQQAIKTYRPIHDARQVWLRGRGGTPAFCSLEDAIARSSLLVGSPAQIIDKVLRYHGQLGHEVLQLPADADGLTDAQHRDSQELFFAEIAPVLRREIPVRQTPVVQAPATAIPVLA